MLQGSLWRQASRVYGSASGRTSAGTFSVLVKNFKTEASLHSSIIGNLCMKLGLVRVGENVSLPCGLSFKSSIHSGNYLCREIRNENERPPLNAERRGLGSMDGLNERPQLFAEGGRTPRSMDYVQGLLNEERGNVLNRQPRLYQPQTEDGMTRRPMDQFQRVLPERVPSFGGGPLLYHQPNFESNADIVHIKLTRNNSFVTLTDSKGNKKLGISAAVASGKGEKPGRYSAEAAAEYVGRKVRQMRLRSVVVKVSGHTFFKRKKDAILAFKDGYTNSRGDVNPIVHIEDTTRKPHNGCRLPKQRRI
ncbi:hypothetical protein ACS0TY_011806 [Phlomoides rotata]